MIIITYVYPKWNPGRDAVRQMSKKPHFRTPFDSEHAKGLQTIEMSKKPRFRTPFDSQHFKGSQTLGKSAWQNFYHIFSSLWEKLTWKMSLLGRVR